MRTAALTGLHGRELLVLAALLEGDPDVNHDGVRRACEALSDAVLCRFPNQAYVDLIYKNPDACMRLLSDICRHLHARVREIERLTVQNAHSRLVSYLLDHVIESNEEEATIRLELPRHVIAARLSAARSRSAVFAITSSSFRRARLR